MWEKYYEPHRQVGNPLYNDDCIFTPAVKVFKSDTNSPKLLAEDDWWDVDVITCAAPNLRENPSNRMNPNAGSRKANIGPEELYKLLNTRIRQIFEIAIAEEAEVLILGAFGCGAFCNPPQIVAKVFEELTKEFRHQFDTVEFAVFHVQREIENYNAFQNAMKEMITG